MERGVKVVNKNNGLLTSHGIQETQTCLRKEEGTALERLCTEVSGGTRLGCILPLEKRSRLAVDEGSSVF